MTAHLTLRILRWTVATLSVDIKFREPATVGPGPVARGVKRISKVWVKGMTA